MSVEGMKVVCRKCSNPVLTSELKKDGDIYVCRGCYEKAHFFDVKDVKEQFGLKHEEPNRIISSSGKSPVRCNNCGYKFAAAFMSNEQLCPYCGETGYVKIDK